MVVRFSGYMIDVDGEQVCDDGPYRMRNVPTKKLSVNQLFSEVTNWFRVRTLEPHYSG